MDKITINTYNKLAQEYYNDVKNFWEKFPKTFFTEFQNRLKHGKVLDIGCGSGRDGLILKEAGVDLIGLDASEAMVKIAKNRGLDVVLGDFLSLPFKEESFVGVWAYTSLLYVPKKEIGKAFFEIKRVLKNDGILGLGLIEGNFEKYRESSGVGKPRWFSFYSKKEIEKLLNDHGFNIVYFEEFKVGTKKYLNYLAITKN